jgi:hypothetical protein
VLRYVTLRYVAEGIVKTKMQTREALFVFWSVTSTVFVLYCAWSLFCRLDENLWENSEQEMTT